MSESNKSIPVSWIVENRKSVVARMDELEAENKRLEAENKRLKALELAEKPDWRIGLTARAKYRNSEFYYERGKIIGAMPSGTNGINDPHGVLKIRLDGGSVILAGADEWVTA